MSERTPEMSEVLDVFARYIADRTKVCVPGAIVSYDHDTQKAAVRPAIRDESLGDLPEIQQAPVLWPRTGKGWMYWPLKPGDRVTLLMADKSIDDYLYQGGIVDAKDTRRHDMNDAFVLPFSVSFADPIPNVDDDDMRLVLEMKNSERRNEFYLGGDTGDIVLNPVNRVRLGGGRVSEPVIKGTEFVDMLEDLLLNLDARLAGLGAVDPTFAVNALLLRDALSSRTFTG